MEHSGGCAMVSGWTYKTTQLCANFLVSGDSIYSFDMHYTLVMVHFHIICQVTMDWLHTWEGIHLFLERHGQFFCFCYTVMRWRVSASESILPLPSCILSSIKIGKSVPEAQPLDASSSDRSFLSPHFSFLHFRLFWLTSVLLRKSCNTSSSYTFTV